MRMHGRTPCAVQARTVLGCTPSVSAAWLTLRYSLGRADVVFVSEVKNCQVTEIDKTAFEATRSAHTGQ